MEIRRIILGELYTNSYVLVSGSSAMIVDPAEDAAKIVEYIEKENLVLEGILVTHGHFDHVGALRELREMTHAPVYMHEEDIPMLGDMEKSLGFLTGYVPDECEIDVILYGGEIIDIGDESVRVLHTPGHSRGSVSYIGEGFVCSGDLIFRQGIGRYDYGSYTDEINSINELFEYVEDSCIILPGHGDRTTVGYEKENNPYL